MTHVIQAADVAAELPREIFAANVRVMSAPALVFDRM